VGDVQREKDVEQLRRIARTQQIQIEHLLKVLQLKSAELDALKGQDGDLQQTLALLERMHARALADEGLEAKPEPPKKKRKTRSGHGPTKQVELAHETERYELDEADRVCPACGGELEELEGQAERSQMVDVVEVRYRLVEVERLKNVCRCGGCVETALGPDRAVEGGRYSLRFGVKVAIDKYVDHLPLARQVRILKRHGVKTTTQTLWDQVWSISSVLRPVYDALYAEVLKPSVIGVDQTGWPALDNKKRKPWQMWCITTEDAVYHRICGDKSARTFVELLGDYEGHVVCDALATHGAGAREGPGIVLAGCWAHVHRRFAEAEPDFAEARLALDWIGELYALDASVETTDERAAVRATESRRVLAKLREWLIAKPALKSTSLGSAIRYTLGQWPRLTRFVDVPELWLDNNRTERGIRGPVVGRRNHFGSKSRRGTEAAAILYSLVETAKVRGVDPARYLADAVVAARRGEILLPASA